MTELSAFEPQWANSPGATILRMLERQRIPVADFAWELEMPHVDVDKLCKGRIGIDEDLASKLEKILGVSAEFWLLRDAQFRADARKLAERISAQDANAWLRKLPTRDMKAFGWINDVDSVVEQVAQYLKFFNVSSVEHYERRVDNLVKKTKFKTTSAFRSDADALNAWLRYGEIQAQTIDCLPWNASKLRDLLPAMRKLTRQHDPAKFLPQLKSLCASAGVALVVARAPRGCRASGATMFLSQRKAMILLSFRHLSEDHFWFAFFHECAHLILHPSNLLVVEGETDDDDPLEVEANNFAEDVLIPPPWRQLLDTLKPNRNDIIRFSVRAGVSPGIVVGQLQHRGRISHGFLNYLKRRFVWEATP